MMLPGKTAILSGESEKRMRRHVIWSVPVFVALVSVCYAGIPGNFHRISAGNKEGKVQYVGVEKGALVLGKRSPHLQKRNETDAHYDRWFVSGTKLKSSTGGGYLAYDPTGKSSRVFLTPKADTEGTDWVIHCPKGVFFGKNESRSVDEEWGILQAASGPMKGWYVEVEEFEHKGEDGKAAVVHRFILSKTPSWNVEVSRMYLHL